MEGRRKSEDSFIDGKKEEIGCNKPTARVIAEIPQRVNIPSLINR